MPTSLPSVVLLHRAVAISEQIQKLETELRSLFGGEGGGGEIPSPFSTSKPGPKTRGGKKGKRVVSAASRAKMAAAQKARWAKKNGGTVKPEVNPKPAAKKKGGMSAEARARLGAIMKARWAAAKKGGKAPNAKKG